MSIKTCERCNGHGTLIRTSDEQEVACSACSGNGFFYQSEELDARERRDAQVALLAHLGWIRFPDGSERVRLAGIAAGRIHADRWPSCDDECSFIKSAKDIILDALDQYARGVL